MNKKTYYWIIGILIALIAVFVVWGIVKGSQPSLQNPPAESLAGNETESGTEIGTGGDHVGMNHGEEGTSRANEGSNELDSSYTKYIKDQDAIMSRMMRDMELTEETKNAALDFIAGMVPHHAAAIDMAESYLKHGGEHKQLKPLAQDIISAQRDEITAMETLYQNILDSKTTDQEQAEAYQNAYQTMMEEHHHMGASTRNSIDAAFAEGMMMHHQMAVDMAQDILEYTEERDVLHLAQQIIDTQKEEMKVMQGVLDNR